MTYTQDGRQLLRRCPVHPGRKPVLFVTPMSPPVVPFIFRLTEVPFRDFGVLQDLVVHVDVPVLLKSGLDFNMKHEEFGKEVRATESRERSRKRTTCRPWRRCLDRGTGTTTRGPLPPRVGVPTLPKVENSRPRRGRRISSEVVFPCQMLHPLRSILCPQALWA